MARTSPATAAKAALDRLLKERDAAVKRLAKVDGEIAELRNALGMAPLQSKLEPQQLPVIIPFVVEESLILPEYISPQDDMGPGRMV